MPRAIKGFKFEATLKEHIRESDEITETELANLTGIGRSTIHMYFQRAEFVHIKSTKRPKKYHGITEKDIAKLKDLATRRYNRG